MAENAGSDPVIQTGQSDANGQQASGTSGQEDFARIKQEHEQYQNLVRGHQKAFDEVRKVGYRDYSELARDLPDFKAWKESRSKESQPVKQEVPGLDLDALKRTLAGEVEQTLTKKSWEKEATKTLADIDKRVESLGATPYERSVLKGYIRDQYIESLKEDKSPSETLEAVIASYQKLKAESEAKKDVRETVAAADSLKESTRKVTPQPGGQGKPQVDKDEWKKKLREKQAAMLRGLE